MHSGYIPFPISVRNSADAVADLLRKTSTTVLLVSPDPGMQRLAHHTKEALAVGGYAIDLFPTPMYSDLYNDLDDQETLRTVTRPQGSNDGTAIILHSSGKHHTCFSLQRWTLTDARVNIVPEADPASSPEPLDVGIRAVYAS